MFRTVLGVVVGLVGAGLLGGCWAPVAGTYRVSDRSRGEAAAFVGTRADVIKISGDSYAVFVADGPEGAQLRYGEPFTDSRARDVRALVRFDGPLYGLETWQFRVDAEDVVLASWAGSGATLGQELLILTPGPVGGGAGPSVPGAPGR